MHMHVKDGMKAQLSQNYAPDTKIGKAWNRVQVMVCVFVMVTNKNSCSTSQMVWNDFVQELLQSITSTLILNNISLYTDVARSIHS